MYRRPAEIISVVGAKSRRKNARLLSRVPTPHKEMGRIPARIDGGVATRECKKVTDSLIDFNTRPIMIEFVIQHEREVKNPISIKEKFLLMEFENSEINLNFSNNFNL